MKKKKVAIIGPTGMLGSAVYNLFKDKYKLVLVYRDEEKIQRLNKLFGGLKNHKKVQSNLKDLYDDYKKRKSHGFYPGKKTKELVEKIGQVDAVINCSGIIIPYMSEDPFDTFFINSSLPHILSTIYKEKFIHITTDCVFDGLIGAPYNEKSSKNPRDLYGLSKSLGEPYSHSLVLRTSIIGHEIAQYNSLLEWTRRQNGKTIFGYTNHIWNGLTTKQLAIILDQIIDNRSEFPDVGLFHLFSTALSKYELLLKIKDKYKLDIKVKPKKVSSVDRRLVSLYDFHKIFSIPSIDVMLTEL
ncbi:MAG TPA: sugar nucleotide-binding protein [Candidatus Saccharimonadales bacterium]|nr:sugar nucleotide-binding protein [Candidatus Saccharimonadales bacterium]